MARQTPHRLPPPEESIAERGEHAANLGRSLTGNYHNPFPIDGTPILRHRRPSPPSTPSTDSEPTSPAVRIILQDLEETPPPTSPPGPRSERFHRRNALSDIPSPPNSGISPTSSSSSSSSEGDSTPSTSPSQVDARGYLTPRAMSVAISLGLRAKESLAESLEIVRLAATSSPSGRAPRARSNMVIRSLSTVEEEEESSMYGFGGQGLGWGTYTPEPEWERERKKKEERERKKEEEEKGRPWWMRIGGWCFGRRK